RKNLPKRKGDLGRFVDGLRAKETFRRKLSKLAERNFHSAGRKVRLNQIERQFQFAFWLRSQILDHLGIELRPNVLEREINRFFRAHMGKNGCGLARSGGRFRRGCRGLGRCSWSCRRCGGSRRARWCGSRGFGRGRRSRWQRGVKS